MKPFVSTTLMLVSSSLLYLEATRFLIIENSRKRSENGDEREERQAKKRYFCVCGSFVPGSTDLFFIFASQQQHHALRDQGH